MTSSVRSMISWVHIDDTKKPLKCMSKFFIGLEKLKLDEIMSKL